MLPFDADTLAHHRRLVARMAEGDTEALRSLHREFTPVIHGIVRRMLDDPEEAREAVQDTFIRAWRRAGGYRADRGEVVAWLVFIARHAAIDRLRQGARRKALHQSLGAEADGAAPPETEASDRREEVEQHLNGLSGPQRRALELAFFSGCTQVEIAAAMQTPVGNVKNHLRRGLLKLRQIVTRHD